MTRKRRIALAFGVAAVAAAPAIASTVSPVAGLYKGHTNEEHHRGIAFFLTDGRMHGFEFIGAPKFPDATVHDGAFRSHAGRYSLHGRWATNTTVYGSMTLMEGRRVVHRIAFSARLPG